MDWGVEGGERVHRIEESRVFTRICLVPWELGQRVR